MLCIVLARMQVGMSAHSSLLKEKKHKKNLKCYNKKGDKLKMEV
jgi:hypothetical protein